MRVHSVETIGLCAADPTATLCPVAEAGHVLSMRDKLLVWQCCAQMPAAVNLSVQLVPHA